MGNFEWFGLGKKTDGKANNNAENLPNMSIESATLADLMQASHNKGSPLPVESENEGLPSVNRRKGGNKLVTYLGFAVILGAGFAMYLGFGGGDKTPKTAKMPQKEEQINSRLPELVIPPPPKRVAVAPTPPPAPTPLLAPTKTILGNPAWSDRKMKGALLAKGGGTKGGGGSTGAGGSTDAAASAKMPPYGEAMQNFLASVMPNASSRSGGARSGGAGSGGAGLGGSGNSFEEGSNINAKFKSTVVNVASASLLPDRNFMITKGTSLDCVLETAIDSSVPGITTCRLTRDIYSDNGQVLLLDRGSQLVGEYQKGLAQGQVRLFVLWTRAKTPNGVIITLDSPGADPLGRSGHDGWVDNHFFKRFGAAILMSLISDTVKGISTYQSAKASDGSGDVYSVSTASGGEKIVEKILETTVNIPPTLIKNQGDHIQIMVAQDLDFSSVYALHLQEKE